MNVLDLFSGIGGFSLGLERAGFKTIAFCEIDPFCQAVLRKWWPNITVFDDVRTLTADRLALVGLQPRHIDAICGGFPCQDISVAGKGEGIEGSRSGLWKEYARIIGELRPRYVIVENVAALLNRGLERVLGDLAALGYDAEWHCIPASAVGAPHRRDRVWIVAYPDKPRLSVGGMLAGILRETECGYEGEDASLDSWWLIEPDVGRVANGVPARVDRLRSLGNAVVPQIPEIIGKAIMEMERCA